MTTTLMPAATDPDTAMPAATGPGAMPDAVRPGAMPDAVRPGAMPATNGPGRMPGAAMPAAAAGLLALGADTLDGHRRRHGPMPDGLDGRAIRVLVAAAGLTGRGGAGFPTHRKMDAVATGADAVVVGNAAEGEPASRKDRVLLARAPHLVLDGLALAARAVGAGATHLYVPASSAAAMRAAVAARGERVTVHIAPDAFVAGEESAVISAINGGPPVPSDKRVRVTERGVAGRPTLVHNVETLAHLALIARRGPDWFRARGTAGEPGTFLATVSGDVAVPGVHETSHGVRLGDLLDAAGGTRGPLRAVLVGGYHGAWLPPDPDIEVSRAGLARYGATPGAGVVVALPTSACGLVESARLVGYLAGQSAGQCGPCVNGLPRMAETFAALARRERRPELVAEVERLARLVTGRGACRHPDGTARLVRSSLHAFHTEVSAHLSGWCTAS